MYNKNKFFKGSYMYCNVHVHVVHTCLNSVTVHTFQLISGLSDHATFVPALVHVELQMVPTA